MRCALCFRPGNWAFGKRAFNIKCITRLHYLLVRFICAPTLHRFCPKRPSVLWRASFVFRVRFICWPQATSPAFPLLSSGPLPLLAACSLLPAGRWYFLSPYGKNRTELRFSLRKLVLPCKISTKNNSCDILGNLLKRFILCVFWSLIMNLIPNLFH